MRPNIGGKDRVGPTIDEPSVPELDVVVAGGICGGLGVSGICCCSIGDIPP